MAPMPLTGTIGTSSSLKLDGEGIVPHRRPLPEPVVSFHLPVTQRVLPQQPEKSRGKNSSKLASAREEQVSLSQDTDHGKLSLESSLVLLQSLRQSRLVHLTALLPHLSTRHRTSTKYHPSPTGHPFPGGLDPSTTSHSLIHLGRADVRVGPLIFPKTRFGEVRVEGSLQDVKGPTFIKTTGKAVTKKEEKPSANVPQAKDGSPSAAYIDDEVVKAVSVAAQKDAKLQALLHTAANGKASPEELRELSKFIQLVSAQLKERAANSASNGAASKPGAASPFPTAAASSSTSSVPFASTSATTTTTTGPASRIVPAPQMGTPSYPPVVTVEFRENPSARFILPLWRGCAVERISSDDERSIKVTMLLPAIGSTAATRAEGDEGKAIETDNGTVKTSPANPPTHEQLTASAPKGAETHAVTWLLSGNRESPLSDGIWHVFGRVNGATTTINGEVVKDTSKEADEQEVQRFVDKLRASTTELSFTPRLRLEQDSLPRDLLDHLTDKFAPRMQTLTSKPIVKLKRGEGEEDEVEIVRDTSKRGKLSAINGKVPGETRKRISTGGSLEVETNEAEDSIMSIDDSGLTSKPKRKRHVAKHNSDGTLKLCQACGTNSTPMWRRGPAGKSTLCNACGAKWKVGRLIVSGDAAPAKPLAKGGEAQSTSASPVVATSALPSA